MAGIAISDQVFAQQEALPDADVGHFRQQAWLLALQAGVDLPFGLGAAVMVPAGRVATKSDTGSVDDRGLGDAELRLRQDITALSDWRDPWVRMTLTAGLVSPTGAYVSRKELVASAAGLGQTMSLGRGAWWAIGEAEVSGRASARLGYLGGVYGRTALTTARDGFGWGTELRATLGFTAQLLPGRLAAAANIEHQWRDVSSEVDFLNDRVPAVNTGGRWVDALPMIRLQVVDWLAISASARLPLWRYVEGVQAVQRLTVIVGMQGTWQPPPRPQVASVEPHDKWRAAKLLAPGKVTVIAYLAPWCSLSAPLTADLDVFAKSRSTVAVVRVDVSEWTAGQLEARLGGAGSLPVIEVYDGNGQLLARLVGDEVAQFANSVAANP